MSDSDPVPLDENRLEYLLDLQHQKYYHLQILARGILGAVISIGAVLATLIAAFYDLFPALSSQLQGYDGIATAMGITPIRIQAIFILNSIIVYIFIWLIVISLKDIVANLSEVVLGRSLMPQSLRETDYVIDYNWEGDGHTYLIFLYSSLQANRELINKSHDRLIVGGLRIVILLVFSITAILLYVNVLEQNLIQVLSYNSLIVASTVFPALTRKLFDVNALSVRERSSTLTQEIFYENSPHSRWNKITTGKWENRLIFLSILLCLISFLIYLLSIFGV